MAYGYARTTDKIGVALVLPGPGALNTAVAIGTAYTASTPILLISGQIESYHLGFHKGVLHELDDQTEKPLEPSQRSCVFFQGHRPADFLKTDQRFFHSLDRVAILAVDVGLASCPIHAHDPGWD